MEMTDCAASQSLGPHRKLSNEKLIQLSDLLALGPLAYGYDTPVWTSERIAALIWSRFRVRYSVGYVKRLLRNARVASGTNIHGCPRDQRTSNLAYLLEGVQLIGRFARNSGRSIADLHWIGARYEH